MPPLNSNAARSARQSATDDSPTTALATAVDRFFVMLRQAIQECGWTHDALAVEMRQNGCLGVDKSVVTRMLNNERPWKPEHLCALPDDVEIAFATKYAESFGLIVVRPAQGEHAARQFVAGLFGLLLSSPLPAKAGHPLKASLPSSAAREIA